MTDEQALLWRRCRAGDRAAREALIEKNLGLAYKVAYSFHVNGLDREDLTQEAVVGLIRAVDTYDAVNGAAFSTYAWRVITHSVFRAVCTTSHLIRLPDYLVLRRATRPTVVSLDAPFRVDDDDATLHDLLPDESKAHLLDAAVASERAAIVRGAVAQLSPPQQEALLQWAGLARGIADRWQVFAATKRLRRMPEIKRLRPRTRKG